MPKIKIPRKSTVVDMTAMTDVAFLLLTFFMLATQFRADEPVIVDTPSSTSDIKLPETGIMMITLDDTGRVFFGIDDQKLRGPLLKKMGEIYNVKFTEKEIKEFSLLTTVGLPVKQLPQFLNLKPEERRNIRQPGIPADSLANELGDWIWQARMANNDIRIAIKGDKDSKFPIFKQVVKTLKEKQVYRYNFITSLEQGQ
jgi:biopolymer transport protein ExbD